MSGYTGNQFFHDDGHNRVMQVDWREGVESEKKLYAGPFEQVYRLDPGYDSIYQWDNVERDGNAISHNHWRLEYTRVYIPTPVGVVGCYTHLGEEASEGVRESLWFLHDHQGSVVKVLDETGALREDFSFDAWGRRREATTWEPYALNRTGYVDTGALVDQLTGSPSDDVIDRGYTGH